MSTHTAQYRLSAEAIKKIIIETGVRFTAEQKITLELTELPPAQRARIISLRNGAIETGALNYDGTDILSTPSEQPALISTPDELFAALDAADAHRAEVVEQARQNSNAKNESVMVAARELLENEHNFIFQDLYPRQAGDNYAETCALVYRARVAHVERNNLRVAAKKKEDEEKKAKKHAERVAWASAYGSVHLKLALANGYDSARLYYSERAVLEYPGYEVDSNNNASWKDRTAPSLDALTELEALKAAHPKAAQIKIVWLTEPVQSDKSGEFYECEAVAVADPIFSKWLVKVI